MTNMNEMKKVHLYVVKYNRYRQELLLDFVREDEFLYFMNRGDYTPEIRLSKDSFQPTMILVHGCAPRRTVRQGAILTLDMGSFLEMNYSQESNAKNRFENPTTVFLEIQDGTYLAGLIDNLERSIISGKIPEEYKIFLDSTWNGSPCALNKLGENIELTVWDVGQGNTNCISDKTNLTIFDFGVSLYYSASKHIAIYHAHADYINGHESVSLIISHWDIDHYNLLCFAPDDFYKKICCIFFPPWGVGVTMKQISARIQKNCRWRIAIPPAKKTSRSCGITKVCAGNNYALFTGEDCKNKNLSGLLLTVFNKDSTAFLTADHSNYQVWDKLYPSVNTTNKQLHIVVPHHGGNCGKTLIPRGVHPGIAAISVGNNSYGHPKMKTIFAYRNAKFMVVQTDQYGHDITIKL